MGTPKQDEESARDPVGFDPEPTTPLPRDFGLTEERVVYLQSPLAATQRRIAQRTARFRSALGTVWWGLMCIVGVVAFVGGWWKSGEVFVPLMSAFIAFMGLFVATMVGMVAFVVVGVVALGLLNWILRRRQHDYQTFQRFKAALREFEKAHGQWIVRRVWFWQSLPGKVFERGVAGLLAKQGWHAEFCGGAGDKGIDVLLRYEGRLIAVQCKAHQRPVGPSVVRELHGSMLAGGASEGWVVSSNGFTPGAHDAARDKPIRLLTIDRVLAGGVGIRPRQS